METVMKPVQNGRGRRRRWSAEQKLTVLQESQTGGSFGRDLPEICRERGADVSVEAQPRPRAQRVRRVGAQESRGRDEEAGRGTRTGLGAEGLGRRQRAGVHLASVLAIRTGHGADPLSHAPTQPGIEWPGGGLLRQLQAG